MTEYSDEALYQRMLEEEQEKVLRLKEIDCHSRIELENEQTAPHLPLGEIIAPGCQTIWDGITCWAKTTSDGTVSVECPSYVVGFDPQGVATRYCNSEGSWYFNPDTNSTWTNYTLCTSSPYAVLKIDNNVTAPHRWLPMVKLVAQLGYGVSILTLVVAVLLLSLIKRLRCPRNTLHMHLFVSFVLRASMALLKDSLFVQGVGLSSDVIIFEGQLRFLPGKDNWACKFVTSLWQFCIMANYSWILMEGLYLHNLIFLALFTDSSAITMYVSLGWGLPVIVVLPWVVLRVIFEDHLCWTTHQSRTPYLVVRLPIIISVLVNFVLFVNIVRVLMIKVSLSAARRKARYGKWARSTLVLMPLFGVHYSLSLGMSYWLGPTLEMIWIFFDQLFASFQGFLVALLYCLLNGEVRIEVGRMWKELTGHITASDETGVSTLIAISRLQLARTRPGSNTHEAHNNWAIFP